MEKKKKEKGKNELKINSNIITICLVVLVVLVLGILIFKNKGNTSNLEKQKQLALSENRMVTVNKNGQYGFVNTKGKELTKLDYDYVLDYDGKYAIVSKNDKNYLIDEHGKEKMSTKGIIKYDETTGFYIVDGVLYNSNLKRITDKKMTVTSINHGYFRYTKADGKKAGVLNSKGKKVYEQDVEKEETFMAYVVETNENNKNTYCTVTPNNQIFAIINCDTGKVIVDYDVDIITASGNNIFIMTNNDKKVVKKVFIQDDKIAVETKAQGNMIYVDEGYVIYPDNKSGKTKYYNVKEKKTYNEEPFELNGLAKSEFETKTGISKIYSNGKYGLINEEKVIIPCEYDNITFFSYDLFNYLAKQGKHYVLVRSNNKTYLLDIKSKKRVKEFNTNETINSLSNSTFIYFTKNNKTYVYNLVTGKENKYNADSVDIYGNHIKVHNGDKVTYYDRNLNKFYSVTEIDKNAENIKAGEEKTEE